jgi:hypothetical protein
MFYLLKKSLILLQTRRKLAEVLTIV